MKPLFEGYVLPEADNKTERGELLLYFAKKTGYTIKRVAFKLTGIPTKDLYYIKSCCDDYENRGNTWGKCFNGMLK